MNGRIRELCRLADVHILPDDSEYGHCIIGLEKFAELIVRKCINICRDVDGVDDHSMRVSRQDCACEIRDYFGIEE